MVIKVSKKVNGNFLARFNVYISALIANISATAATCVMSWSSPTLPRITKPGEKIFVTVEQGAWLSSIAPLGACCGPFVTGPLIDHLGRKCTVLWIMVLFMTSWTILYFCEYLPAMYFARFIAGLGVGCIYATLPIYMTEMAPVKLRGSLGSLLQLFDCFGYLIEYIVGGIVTYKTLIVVSGLIPLICILTLIWIPESPYHLHNKGNEKEALKSLRYFRGYIETSKLQREIGEMNASATNLKANKGSLKVLFSSALNLRILYYSLMLSLFQQLSGVNIVTFYSQTIFEEAGSTFSANHSAIIVAGVMTVTAALTAPAARMLRIKRLLMFSSVGNTISMIALGFYFYVKDVVGADVKPISWIPITSLVVFIFSYTMGFGPLIWIISSEIFPSHIKAVGCAFTASFNWFLCFILTRFFSTFIYTFGEHNAFWFFACCSFVSFFFVTYQLPETQGKTFQEIQEMIRCDEKRKINSKQPTVMYINTV